MRGTLGFHALVALGVLLCVAGSGWSAPVQLFVAPDGRDTDPGTKARPFASLHRARDEIRKLKADGDLPNGATVLVGEGSYFLAEPLTFGPEDSGTAEGPITYSAAPGATVALRGSRPVTGWKPFKRDIYQTDLGDVDLGPSRFWQVFYKGARQPLARFPNFDAEHPRTGGFTYIKGTLADDNTTHLPYEPWGAARTASKTALLYDPERLAPEGWSQPEQARIHVWPWLNWGRNVLTVQAVDTETHTLILQNRASYALMEGNRFFVENVFEELDAPGEWYFDEGSKQLYFWPPDGKSPEGQVTVPVLNDLIRLAGDKASGRFVEHIRIHGFALAETHHSLVDLSVAAHCKISACALSGCGRTALSLSAGSHHNEIAGCDIAHVGNSAIVLAGVTDWTHTLQGRISHNLVTNNHVHDVGEGGNAWAAIAINPACGGNVTHDNVVSHNLVHDTPRQGINFNGFRNIVERNHVHHTNQEQSDTGAIGMGSRDIHERGSIIRHNYIHDAGGYCMLKPGVWEYPHYCWGVYLDDYTSGVHVYGNLIVRAQRGGVMVHGGQDNIIENNIIVDSLQQQVELMPIDSLTSGRTPAHPDKSEWLMTGTKILGNIIYYRADAALWARGSKWEQALAESDRNLIWHRKRPIAANLSGVPVEESWAAWRELGYDADSVIANPRFVDPAHDDYRLRPDSPALALGFEPIPVDEIGLYQSPDRASWPVDDDPWREEHLTHPEGPPEALTAAPPRETPVLKAVPVEQAPIIDGRVEAPEWDWDAPGAKVTVAELSLASGAAEQPSYAMVSFDRDALYVALVNEVSDATKVEAEGGTWGADDGAEICLQDVSGPKPEPIFVVHGFPSGKWASVEDAGAPAKSARRLETKARYAATIGDGQWSGEWMIPFDALGVDAGKVASLRFNIGVLKAAEREWIAWVSTGAAPWSMERAGKLVLAR